MGDKFSKNKNSACDMAPIHDTMNSFTDVYANEQFQKELLEIQHKNNLEIHERQTTLTREIHKKQVKLVVVSTLVGVVFGAILTTYLPPLKTKEPISSQTQPQQIKFLQKTGNHQSENSNPHQKETSESSAPAEAFSSSVSSVPKNSEISSSIPPIKKGNAKDKP